MKRTCMSNKVWASSLSLFTLVASALPSYAQVDKHAFTAGGTIAGGNAYYEVYVQDLSGQGVGLYTATTGTNHPVGLGLNVLYGDGDPGTTFNTIRSFTTGTDYVQKSNRASTNTLIYLDQYGVATALGTQGARTVYTLPGPSATPDALSDSPPATPDALTVIQDVLVNGTTFSESRIDITTQIINRGTNAVEVGIRYLWDYQIAQDDGPTFQALFPDGPVLTKEAQFVQPVFEAYRIEDNDDNPNPPTFNILGSVNSPGTLRPYPTAPDLLQFASWSGSYATAFDYSVDTNRNIASDDSAVLYYFGHDRPRAIVIGPGQTNSVTARLFLTTPCTLFCPGNIVVTNAAGQCCAEVNYQVPSVNGRCGPVTCIPPPGSSFPLGTNLVTCSLTNGSSCTFSVVVLPPPPIGQCSRTYTLNADFALGTLFNLNLTNVPDQLQINSGSLSTFPIMWVANGGEDSVSKMDTTTGRELARYRTWFGPAGQPGYFSHLGNPWGGAAPSRTAVDREGNCYVANRHFDNRPADVIKILATGGIDRNGNGTIETSLDSDNNGIADPAEILPMGDANGNGQIDPSEIGDERIAWAVSVGPAGGLGRSLAIDIDGNIWLGLYNTKVYYKLSAVDGSILAGPIDVSPNTPYGALVDGNGILWGASLGGTLLKLDTRTNTKLNVYNHGFGTDYGIAIGNNRVYQANLDGNTYTEFNPVSETFTSAAASRFSANGIAVDGNGDIFVGKDSGGATKFRPDGTVIWTAVAQVGTGQVRGCVVDSNNDVWLIHLDTSKISKYRGSDGSALGVFPTGDSPYTYTDATGIGRFNSTAPSGTWTVIHDSSSPGAIWGTVSWNGSTPPGTGIKVEVRAADTQLTLAGRNYQEVTNSTSFCNQGIAGQLIQIRTTLSRPLAETNSPVLYDLTVAGCAGCVSDSTNLVKYSMIPGTSVSVGQVFTYEISFDTSAITNTAVALRLVDQLPIQEDFLAATTNGTLSVVYDAATHTVVWDFGTWPPLTAGPTNIVTVRLNTNAVAGSTVLNLAILLSSNLPPVVTHDRNPHCPTCRPGLQVSTVPTNCPLWIQSSVVETNTLRVRQTGLFYQTVGVTNTCGTDIAGCRLYLDGLSPNVTVHNASGVSNGVPYLQYHLPILAHQGIEFTVEYYVPDRRTIPNPTFRGEGGAASVPPNPAGTLGDILRFKAYTNCAVLVEFSTLSNRLYYVQYASDLGTNGVWKTAVPAVLGNGTAVQWLDSGPPKTESRPCTQPSRYYRVLLAP